MKTKLERNVGDGDRLLRVILGLFAMLLGILFIQGVVGMIIGFVGLVSLLTGLVGWCGLYTLLGINTYTEPSGSGSNEPSDKQ